MSAAPEQVEETERRQRLALHAENARLGFFAVAGDILETMKRAGVQEAEACVMTGALEMAVQTWLQVAMQSGVPPQKARKTLEAELRRFWQKHMDIERRAAAAPPPKVKEVIEK